MATAQTILYGDRMTELSMILDQMTCAPYNQPATKLQKAYETVLEDRVTVCDTSKGLFTVASATHADVAYQVHEGTCQCPYARAHPQERYACTHSVAVRLYTRWQQSLSPLCTPRKETLMASPTLAPPSAPFLTEELPLQPPQSPQEAQEPFDDIEDPLTPPAVLEAATAPLEPPGGTPERFGEHEALLQGFCQVLQQRLHAALYSEHKSLMDTLDASLSAVRLWVEQMTASAPGTHALLGEALGQLVEQGVLVRSDPYTATVTARSAQGFAVTFTVRKQEAVTLTQALPALLNWLATEGYTPAP
jgi:hypothetical protein